MRDSEFKAAYLENKYVEIKMQAFIIYPGDVECPTKITTTIYVKIFTPDFQNCFIIRSLS
jgi:hypothetical protein